MAQRRILRIFRQNSIDAFAAPVKVELNKPYQEEGASQ
jgi:hypothetical protein